MDSQHWVLYLFPEGPFPFSELDPVCAVTISITLVNLNPASHVFLCYNVELAFEELASQLAFPEDPGNVVSSSTVFTRIL